ncbi:MAG: UDP-glucose/GDP-mannose dehydrogenase family protein [Pseudomonadota bacterium]
MKITVVGSGYVGLVSGACLADLGNDVVCLDVDRRRIEILNSGEMPIYEPGLKEIVGRNFEAGRLQFTTDVEFAVHHGLVQLIAVGTPPDEDGQADLSYVLAAAQAIARVMTEHRIVVNKSTVPVGTAGEVRAVMREALQARGLDLPFAVLSNPEFLKEGAAIEDFTRPDRIVIGSDDPEATEVLRRLYAPFERNHAKVMVMDVRSAELTKYAANAMLATRISFMNELAQLADKVGADIEHVRRGIGSDPRIGTHFLYAGCGYGGSCFPKDVRALIHAAQAEDVQLRVLSAVEAANDSQKGLLGRRIVARFGRHLHGRHFAVWGLAFKPNTDDMREAPSIALIRELIDRGATVAAYDPVATTEARRVFGEMPGLSFSATAHGALRGASALVVATEWKEFRGADLASIRDQLAEPVVFDGRNVFDPTLARTAGLEYVGIGRPRWEAASKVAAEPEGVVPV